MFYNISASHNNEISIKAMVVGHNRDAKIGGQCSYNCKVIHTDVGYFLKELADKNMVFPSPFQLSKNFKTGVFEPTWKQINSEWNAQCKSNQMQFMQMLNERFLMEVFVVFCILCGLFALLKL